MKNPTFLITVFVGFFGGCCWTAKRSCFPPCPPPKIVEMEKECKLPPKLVLPKVEQDQNCQEKQVCYDLENAAKLADRLSKMKDWIKETRKRCEK